MLRLIIPCFLALTAGIAVAQESSTTFEETPNDIILPGEDTNLSEFVWKKRPLVVFAESPDDPRFITQMEMLTQRIEDLSDRDVVVLTDTNPDANSDLREELHPRGFMLTLISKDGTILLRKPSPWNVREIGRVIDKLPERQQEIRDRRGGS